MEAYREAADVFEELKYVRGKAQVDRDMALCLQAMGHSVEAQQALNTALRAFRRVGDRHGEATCLVAVTRITGEPWHAEEARALLARHGIPFAGELLAGLVADS